MHESFGRTGTPSICTVAGAGILQKLHVSFLKVPVPPDTGQHGRPFPHLCTRGCGATDASGTSPGLIGISGGGGGGGLRLPLPLPFQRFPPLVEVRSRPRFSLWRHERLLLIYSGSVIGQYFTDNVGAHGGFFGVLAEYEDVVQIDH